MDGLAFKTDYETGARPVVVTFHTNREATLGVALFADGRFVGNTTMRSYEAGIHDAGGRISIHEPLNGTVTVRAVVYRDDGDGRFERHEDDPVTWNGSPVSTIITMEFSSNDSGGG